MSSFTGMLAVPVPTAGRTSMVRSRTAAPRSMMLRAKLSAGSRAEKGSINLPRFFKMKKQKAGAESVAWKGEKDDLQEVGIHGIDLDRLESSATAGSTGRVPSLVDPSSIDNLERSYSVSPAEPSTSGRTDGVWEDEEAKVESKQDVQPLWWPSAVPYPSPRVRGLVLLNLLAFLFGSNMVAIKHTQEVLDPITFSACRFALASVAFAPFLPAAVKNPKVRKAGIELGTWLSVGYVTQGVGLLSTDASRASFLSTFTVIAVPLMAGICGQKIAGKTWGAAAMAVMGVILLEGGDGAGLAMSTGDVLSLVSAVFFGLHIFRTETTTSEFEPETTIPLISIQLTTVAVLSSAAMMLTPGIDCIGMFLGEVDGLGAACNLGGLGGLASAAWADISAAPIVPLVYCGLVTTATCLWIECVALKTVSSTEAAVIYTAEPLWGAMFAWVLLGERWGAMGWMGAALILSGSLMAQLGDGGHGSSSSSEKARP